MTSIFERRRWSLRSLRAGICRVLALSFLVVSSETSTWAGNINNYLQLELERLRSQEEEKREAGRERRRAELERERNANVKDREALSGAILESSEAALRAPQGVFYRMPGFI